MRQSDGRTLDRFIDPAPDRPTMRAVSITARLRAFSGLETEAVECTAAAVWRQCCDVAAVSGGRIGGRRCVSTLTTTSSNRDARPRRGDVDGVPAQLVISIPLIGCASRAPNPRRRTVCVAPAAPTQLRPARRSCAQMHAERLDATKLSLYRVASGGVN